MNTHEMHKMNLFLYRRGLVESRSSLELTIKGFEVALQIEKTKNDEKNRKRTLQTTQVIAIAASINVIAVIGLDVMSIIVSIFY